MDSLLALTGAFSSAAGNPEHLLAPPTARNGLPLPLVTTVVGGLFMGTLAISRFSLRAGIPAILGVLLFGLAINPESPLISHETIERLHTLSLSMLLFYAGLSTELRSIRGFLEYGLMLAVGGVVISSLLLGVMVCFLCPTMSAATFSVTPAFSSAVVNGSRNPIESDAPGRGTDRTGTGVRASLR
ncbi:MAG: hypothetical protein EBZ76_13205 [Synechococcaceae bacterium WB9_2_170]|nr:hypothetical protein [Synechococcaceae bacterium WB9_2_170]